MLSYKLLWIAGAGAAGTLARYSLARMVETVFKTPFPWGVTTVNLLGCFLFGLVWAYTEDHLASAVEIRMAVLTGFMGAFTTFSTLIFDTGMLIKESQWMLAMINIAGQNILGLGALALGFIVVRQIW